MSVTPTPIPDIKASHPHVDGITDWRAQQTTRLLWDRVAELEARLQATEGTTASLVTASNAHDAKLTLVDTASKQALAKAQVVPNTDVSVDPPVGP